MRPNRTRILPSALMLFALLALSLTLFARPVMAVSEPNALNFDGIDDYVLVNNGSTDIANSSTISLSGWVNGTRSTVGWPGFEGFFGFRNNADADFYIARTGTSTVEARFINSIGTSHQIVINGVVMTGWHYWTLTYDGATLTLYRDGLIIHDNVTNVASTMAATGSFKNDATLPFYLGRLDFNTNRFWLQGSEDNVTLWTKALSQAEVQASMETISASDAGLSLFYDFDQGTAGGTNTAETTLLDRAGTATDGTLTSMALTGSTSNWVSGIPIPAVRSITRAGATSHTQAAVTTFTVTFNMPVTGVDPADFTLTTTGGQSTATIGTISGSGKTWSVPVNTVANQSGTIRLNLVDDDSIIAGTPSVPLSGSGTGNGNFAAGEVYTIDWTAPTVVLSTSVSDPTNASPFLVTVTFSEDVIGFVQGDLTLGNATPSNFTAVSGSVYTFNLTPTANGAVTVDVAAGVATDAVGYSNTVATQLSSTYDGIAPVLTLTTPAGISRSNVNAYPVGGTCTTGDGNVTVSVGSVSGSIACSNAGTFTRNLNVSGLVDGASIAVSARQTDTASNLGSASTTTSKDTIAPVLTLTTPAVISLGNVAAYPVGGTCTTGDGNVTVSVGSVSGSTTCDGSGTFATTLDVSSLSDGASLAVSASQTDTAGNLGTISTTTSKDTVAPTVVISTSVSDPTNASPILVTVTFSEDVTGFTVNGLSVTNATLGTFTAVSGSVYTVNLTPTNGTVTVDVAAGVATDAAGNSNSVATQLSRTYDGIAPILTLTTPAVITTANVAAYPVGGTCTIDDGNVTVNVGSVSGNTACDGSGNFATTLDVSGLVDGASLAVSASQTDTAGNLGSASATTSKDTTAPVLALTTPAVITTANVAAYPVGGTCTIDDGNVTVNVGSVSGSTACDGSGTFATTLDVSGLVDGASLAVSASQTDTASNLGSISTTTSKNTASANADLSGLTLSDGTLSPNFAAGIFTYTASVTNSVGSLIITPSVAEAHASVKVNGAPVTSATPSGAISLSVGDTGISVEVTAQDGTVKTYTITVTRAAADASASSNADLSGLTLSDVTLSPSFAAGIFTYTASVTNSIGSITITPSVAEAHASVKVNGAPVTSATPSGAISLSVGDTGISVEVTAQDGTVKTYTITVTRAGGADVAITQSYALVKEPTKTGQAARLAALTNTLALTITVRNYGPDDVSGVVVADTFPQAAAGTIWTWTCAGTGGGVCGTASGSGDLHETLGLLPNGGQVIFTVTGSLANPNNWRNAPTATTPAGVVESRTENNSTTVGNGYLIMLPLIIR